MTFKLGGNDFFGVPFPLVLADRFFHIYTDSDGEMKTDVFRWDEERREPVYEVLASRPLEGNITANPSGIVTFSEEPGGGFLFKFRPKPGVSQIFGLVPVTDEFDVRITDREIVVTRGATTVARVEKNMFAGIAIGIQIGADGSTAIGVSGLPEGMVLARPALAG